MKLRLCVSYVFVFFISVMLTYMQTHTLVHCNHIHMHTLVYSLQYMGIQVCACVCDLPYILYQYCMHR